uniref:Uncharacterized protein n=1 Tax=viral metagenome TaxID=1070528 RepID=A0A6H1ZTL4_9ZZZZ
MMGTEIISFYESVARNLGDIKAKGTPTGCTGTTLDSNMLLQPFRGQLQGKEVFIYSGGGAGQARIIPTFDPTNNRIYIEPAWDTIPTASSKFIIFDKYFTEDYESAMNRAIGICRLKHLNNMVATMQIVATQYEYTVPSGMEWISTLRIVPSGNTDYGAHIDTKQVFEFPPRYWHIGANPGGSYVIAFDSRKIDLDDFNEEVCYIMGQCKPDFAGTLISEELQEFVVAHSSMLLSLQRINEGQEWQRKFYAFRDMARSLEDYIFSYGHGKSVK